jgi:hypothetical protein
MRLQHHEGAIGSIMRGSVGGQREQALVVLPSRSRGQDLTEPVAVPQTPRGTVAHPFLHPPP